MGRLFVLAVLGLLLVGGEVRASCVISGFSPAATWGGSTLTLSGSGFTGATSVIFNSEARIANAGFTVVSDTEMAVTVPTQGLITGSCYITVVTGSAVGFTLAPTTTVAGPGSSIGLSDGGVTVYVESGGSAAANGGGSDTFYVKSGGTANMSGGGSNVAYAEPGANITGGTVITTPEVDASPVSALFSLIDPPPTVTTGAATSVSFTDATLSGTVNPEGARTTAYFQYGTTTGYGNQTTAQNPGRIAQAAAITASVSGLTAGTLYHYQLVAINTSGTSYGADATFTTVSTVGGGLPGVVNVPVTGESYDSAVLNASVDPNGAATGVYFEYGLTAGYGLTTGTQSIGNGATDVAVQAAISGLQPNTTYHYCVVAANGNGTTTGTDETFQSGAVGIASFSPAAAPNGATVTLYGVGFTGATIVEFYGSDGLLAAPSFAVLSDTVMTATVPSVGPRTGSYNISVITAAGATLTLTASSSTIIESGSTNSGSGGSALFYIEGGGTVTNDGAGSCTYFVKSGGAVIGSGGGGDNVAYAEPGATVTLPGLSVVTVPNVSQSPVASLFQITPPGPAVVTGNAVNVEFTDATVNGTVNPEFGGRTTTYFQYGTSTSYGSQSAAQNTLGAGQQTSPVSATLTGLLPNTLYHYQLVASNAGGTDNGADETFTTGSLPGNGSPGVLNEPANGATCNAVTLNAAVDANGVATNVTFEYGLTNAYGTTTAAQPIGSGTTDVAVSGSLSGLTPNTTYHYCVVAANGNGTTTGTDETFQTGAVGIFSFSPAQGGPGATLTLQGVGFTTTTGVVFESEIGASATASYVVLSDTEMTVTVPNAESRSEGCYITVLTSAGATVTVDPTLTVVENGDVTTAGGGATVYVEGGGVATNDGSGSDTYFIMSGGVLNGSGGGGGNVAYVEAGASVTLGGVTTVAEPVISQSPVTAAFQYISPARAVTGTCSGIAMNAATVSGTVNPEGSIATAYIAYGPETGSNGANAEAVSLESADPVYTSQTASESIGSGTSDLPLSLNLTGLTSNTLYHYSVVVSNSAGMTYGADEEFTTAPSPYNIWDENEFTTAELSNQAMSGATGDPMGDGVSNLMKYALGLNPMVGTTAGLPVSGTAVINGTNCHTFTYTKVDAATDITYHPEWSSDLATWTNTGLTEVVLSDNGTTQVVQDSLPVSGTGPVFFHLRVTMP